jgi:LytR cell envelope-related transcriptional attenuator
VEHVEPFDRTFPWRTTALVAAALAFAELLALLVVAGVRLAPARGHAASPPASAAAPSSAPVRRSAPRTPAHRKPQPLRARARVSVLVLNGNGVTGAAGREAARLLRKGYRRTTSADAPNHDYARSIVLYAPGWSREGRRLGHDTGVRIVGPLDGLRRSQLRGSQLVVILGGS